tara:strand:- start:3944 stop:4135 length:192 start_codon:yes stop_codon:yes gene_type:complete
MKKLAKTRNILMRPWISAALSEEDIYAIVNFTVTNPEPKPKPKPKPNCAVRLARISIRHGDEI